MPIFGPFATHRDVLDFQAEHCQLCGLLVGGAHLHRTYAEGIAGLMVCDVTPGCREYGAQPDWRIFTAPQSVIGQGRVYPPGAPDWTGDPWLGHIYIVREDGIFMMREDGLKLRREDS